MAPWVFLRWKRRAFLSLKSDFYDDWWTWLHTYIINKYIYMYNLYLFFLILPLFLSLNWSDWPPFSLDCGIFFCVVYLPLLFFVPSWPLISVLPGKWNKFCPQVNQPPPHPTPPHPYILLITWPPQAAHIHQLLWTLVSETLLFHQDSFNFFFFPPFFLSFFHGPQTLTIGLTKPPIF